MTDPNVVPGILVGIALFAGVAIVVLTLLWVGRKILLLIEKLFLAAAPKRLGPMVVAVVRFYIWAALLCGLAAFGMSLAILGDHFPDDIGDPVLRSPLLWLTCLAVMTGIIAIGIAGGLLVRYAVERVDARLHEPPVKK
jgi:hypothetical protein